MEGNDTIDVLAL